MKITDLPFDTVDWNVVERTTHAGATGEAHWHTLLRARAIENAAYVVAAAQSGLHQDGRSTFGHSLVVDPWGTVLLDMGEGQGVGFAKIDLETVQKARKQIPVLDHRRPIPHVTHIS